jgi:hypothetical protein
MEKLPCFSRLLSAGCELGPYSQCAIFWYPDFLHQIAPAFLGVKNVMAPPWKARLASVSNWLGFHCQRHGVVRFTHGSAHVIEI